MNSVAFAERSKTAAHEAAHAACALFFDVVPTEIRIEPAPESGGYCTGYVDLAGKPAVSAVTLAVGVRAGHGYQADEASLAEMVPDPDERDRIMDVAARVMEHRQFRRLRDALRTRLQFRDVLHPDEIERIAAAALGLPDTASFPQDALRVEVATSAGVRVSSDHGGKVANAASGNSGRASLPAGVPTLRR